MTVLNQTPSAFRQLDPGRAGDGADPAALALRYVIFGGEALDLQSLSPWFERHGDAAPQLVNMYGITETTVHVTYRPITLADVEAAAGSVIGRPIPDLQRLPAGRAPAAGAGRRAGRDLRRRRRRGARLPQPPGADRRALRRRSVHAHEPARGCTAPATWRAACPTATSSTSDASTTR